MAPHQPIELSYVSKLRTEFYFPTPIYFYDAETRNDKNLVITEDTINWVMKVKEEVPNAGVSNVGGYQSPFNKDFKEIPYRSLEYVRKNLGGIPEFELQNWWINISEKGSYNWHHTHPDSHLALVWYLTPNYGTIKFDHPLQHVRNKLHRVTGLMDSINYTCNAGDILVFPADLVHYVTAHEQDTPRISISMNMRLI